MNSEQTRFDAHLDDDKALIAGRFVFHDNAAIDAILEELTAHIQKQAPKTGQFELTLYLDYVNTWSRKRLMRFMADLSATAKQTGATITVRWVTEEDDEDMVDLGEIFRDSCDLPFDFLETLEN
jgi:hypothetical protein